MTDPSGVPGAVAPPRRSGVVRLTLRGAQRQVETVLAKKCMRGDAVAVDYDSARDALTFTQTAFPGERQAQTRYF